MDPRSLADDLEAFADGDTEHPVDRAIAYLRAQAAPGLNLAAHASMLAGQWERDQSFVFDALDALDRGEAIAVALWIYQALCERNERRAIVFLKTVSARS